MSLSMMEKLYPNRTWHIPSANVSEPPFYTCSKSGERDRFSGKGWICIICWVPHLSVISQNSTSRNQNKSYSQPYKFDKMNTTRTWWGCVYWSQWTCCADIKWRFLSEVAGCVLLMKSSCENTGSICSGGKKRSVQCRMKWFECLMFVFLGLPLINMAGNKT